MSVTIAGIEFENHESDEHADVLYPWSSATASSRSPGPSAWATCPRTRSFPRSRLPPEADAAARSTETTQRGLEPQRVPRGVGGARRERRLGIAPTLAPDCRVSPMEQERSEALVAAVRVLIRLALTASCALICRR